VAYRIQTNKRISDLQDIICYQICQNQPSFHPVAKQTLPLDWYINDWTSVYPCKCVILVCFYWSLFQRSVWGAWVFRWSSNGTGGTGQTFTQLEITIWDYPLNWLLFVMFSVQRVISSLYTNGFSIITRIFKNWKFKKTE